MNKGPQSLSAIKNSLILKTRRRLKPVIQNRRTASYFTLTLTLFSLSFFGLFAIRPTLITAITLIKEVNDLKKLSLDYENKISNIILAQSEYERIRESLLNIEAALPGKSDFTGFSKAMEKLAFNNGVVINQLQIDSAPISIPQTNGLLSRFNFILIGVGAYENVNSYLADIYNYKRIVTINSMDFTPEGGTVSGILRISMKGKAYYEP
ncbi:hypothetical protein A3D05_05210 [Candidatus Gottesmanbacteria bacterium RIFCSPHIGHO2_02_FULL_40_24]|uniref:Type 4 fimbrial biogenesis protein PilO n=1 Tax=Candidatus Gottesmanbacteria bacterium RIFCSPHIGHO2_01_FULL_40_15 TaxID=1798376 RepID=A0A1F5Z6N3_9BACT|nr:MAG: hypothetical protein A2777_01845 [Candidatus Gottesmanbacteria bacterium RIFCSPHIGHO2_01_FULL_40_15]OGG16430.1 MAG: hypothetical protein A3D05_05210 [Candidatus Gottesmanbacteria bacterium RIFCSPHIGHO2_02_FULL_40_24]OGG22712.1 MAG: hypothetical protein A3B48_02840 [Candidatus Gottesmanbacteria bacterium RIFCSPLOWO2_01_FULL_40_10]OGG25544.1 MAG: hypothetical protein A3E42_04360 [Candidatus Gottesmanbacteria bacterium RIFCSPHIGHO2_12_FULL_40_13]OGG32552.1 MAG: hypothetical protein A3I80_0